MAAGRQPAEARAAHGRQRAHERVDHPYPREVAAAAKGHAVNTKYWPSVGRVDNVYGDRNLFCSCIPVEDLA